MGKLLDLLQAAAGESSLHSLIGRWRQEVSADLDQASASLEQTAARVDQIESIAAGEVNALAGPGLVPDGTQLAVGQNPDNSVIVNADNIQVNPTIQAGAAAGATALQNAGAGLTEAPAGTVNVGANADGSIVVNPDDIQVSAAIQAGSAAGASAVQPTRTLTAGAGLTGGGDLSADRTFDVGQNATNLILVNANDIQLNPAIGASINGGLVYLTQTDWAVNSTTGNDSNAGTAASPLLTLAELARRWNGRTFSPAIATVTVQLTGTFPAEVLALDNAIFTSAVTVTVSGTMTEVDNGTVTAITAWNGAAAGADGTRGQITDAAQDFTPHLLRRIRLTSGANSGSISNVASLGGGVTIANTGQFSSITPATTNPAVNDTYSIETFNTVIAGWSFHLYGPVNLRVRDIDFTSVATPAGRNGANVGENETRCLFFGCRINGTVSTTIEGKDRYAGCSFEGALLTFNNGFHLFLNNCFFNFVQMNSCIAAPFQANLFEGGGIRNAGLFVGNDAYLESIGGGGNFGIAFYGVINGTASALVVVEDFAQVVFSNAAANFIGATGNTTVSGAALVRNGCGITYVTKPKATGNAPGVTDVTLGGTAQTWAAIPLIAAAPNNAFVNVRQ